MTGSLAIYGENCVQLVVLAMYCLVIYHYRDQVTVCLKNIAGFSPGNISGTDNRQLYSDFLKVSMVLAALMAGLGVMKVAGEATTGGVEAVTGGMPGWLALTAPLVAGIVVAGISLVKFGTLKAAGELTFSGDFTGALAGVKLNHTAAAAMLLTPLVMIFSGENPVRDRIVLYGTLGVLFALALSFVVQSALLFRKQKVSFLVWFLYLCAVEIFPVGFVLLLAIKNA